MKSLLVTLAASSCLTFTATMDAAAKSSGCLGGSVSPINTISAGDIREVGTVDVADALSRLPSIRTVNGNHLGYNSNTSQITVRGVQNGSSGPLYVVDGNVTANGFSLNNLPLSELNKVEVLKDTSGATYGSDAVAGVTPRDIESIKVLKGPAATAIYGSAAAEGVVIITTKKHQRGTLATENGGELVNPALGFEYDLDGSSYGVSAEVCMDVGRIMPLSLDFGISRYDLDGSDNLKEQYFSEGLGVTGIGGTPGVYIPSPTDVSEAHLDVDRKGTDFMFNLGIPLKMGVYGGSMNGDGFIIPSGSPSFGVTSVLVGLSGGTLDQTETTRFYADTPAYGANSESMGEYRTKFDGNYLGASVGVGYSHTYFTGRDTSLTFGLKGLVEYKKYDFDVSERVDANILNGTVDYHNDQKYDFSDDVFSATVTASIDWKRDNLTLGVYADFTTGKVPEINRYLPDSDIHGPLDPEYSLSSSPSASFGVYGRLKF